MKIHFKWDIIFLYCNMGFLWKAMRKIRKIFMWSVVLLLCILAAGTGVYAKEGQAGIYVVSQDGRGDFATIQEGVDAVPSGSTLIIYDGVYNETVKIHDKTVNLKGVNKDTCILRQNSDHYYEVPLEIAAGSVENLTIYGYTERVGNWIVKPVRVSDEYINSFETDDEKNVARTFSGYAVHIEQDYMKGKTLSFTNCRIISENNCCVGVGLRAGSRLSFTYCDFEAYSMGADMYIHDDPAQPEENTCSVDIVGCNFYNYSSFYFFELGSLGDTSRVMLTFMNNTVHTVALDSADYYANSDYGSYTIGDMLAGAAGNKLVALGFSRNDLIYTYDNGMTAKLYDEVLGMGSAPDKRPFLPEGIIRLWNGSSDACIPGYFPILIANGDGKGRGYGWCGASSFYLAPESRGNTLAQMNSR